jgi:ATP-dependent DNA helicase RecQ
MTRLMDRALLWMHEQQVVTLGRGLTVFRPAITVHLNPKGGRFTATRRPVHRRGRGASAS